MTSEESFKVLEIWIIIVNLEFWFIMFEWLIIIHLSQLRSPGPSLDLLCIQQSDAVPIHENYAKLYFDAKHFKKGLNRGGEIFGALYFKKVSFLANTGCCSNFLD